MSNQGISSILCIVITRASSLILPQGLQCLDASISHPTPPQNLKPNIEEEQMKCNPDEPIPLHYEPIIPSRRETPDRRDTPDRGQTPVDEDDLTSEV